MHPLWANDESAPSLWREACALLLLALQALDADRLKGILERPDAYTAERIRDAVKVWLVEQPNDPRSPGEKLDPELILAALDLLESKLLEVHSEETDRRVAVQSVEVAIPDRMVASPIPPRLAGLRDAFIAMADPDRRWIAQFVEDPTKQGVRATGLLAALLVTRSGLCARPLLVAAIDALATGAPIRCGTDLYWIETSLVVAGTSQRRRVFVDPMTIAAWCRARTHLTAGLPEPGNRDRAKALWKVVRSGYGALIKCLGKTGDSPPCGHVSLADLMVASSTMVSLESAPLLGAYARNEIPSSSLYEDAWIRLAGLRPSRSRMSAAMVVQMDGLDDFRASRSPAEQAMQGDLDNDPESIVVKLRRATDAQRRGERGALAALCATLERGTTAWLITDWLRHMADEARNKGKALRASTVHNYRAIVANRVLALAPERLDGVSGEELSDLYQEIVDTGASLAQRGRLRDLLGRIHAYGIQIDQIPGDAVTKPRGPGGSYEVSARFVTEQAYRAALGLLASETYGTVSEWDRHTARCFLILAYRFGLRRAEILGLTLADLKDGNRSDALVVRANEIRDLKTRNARRILPLSLLTCEEAVEIKAIRNRLGVLKFREELPPFLNPPKPAHDDMADHPGVDLALQALRETTGDASLHAHHLRHSFATRHVLGALIGTLPEEGQRLLPAWMVALEAQSAPFHDHYRAALGTLAMRGTMVSMAMGHGRDEVTYEHYVHGLDVLVPCILANKKRVRARQRARSTPAEEAVVPSDVEMHWIATLCGLAQTSRPPDDGFVKWLVLAASEEGVTIELLESEGGSVETPLAPTLQWALGEPELQAAPGLPRTVAQRASASTLFTALNNVKGLGHQDLSTLLDCMFLLPLKDGWFNARTEDARSIWAEFSRLLDGALMLEMRAVEWQGRKRVERVLKDRAVGRWLAQENARVDLRVADPSARPGQVRQRGTHAVAWAMRAVACWLASARPG